MKKNRFIYLTVLTTIIMINSCSKNETKECYFAPEITVNIDKSHPCLPTGTIEITAPINFNYTYRIDQKNFQRSTLFENISAGKHTLTVKDNDGCITSKEVLVDTIPKGNKFTEVASILKTRCASCHSGINPHAGIDFTSVCDVLNHWNRIQARTIEGNPTPMPPSGLITTNERNKLLDWINSGHRYEE
jgi:hypothetical protein